MLMYNKYESIQLSFSKWQHFGNLKFKQKSFGMCETTFYNSKFPLNQN
jgi:hypothetical protein